MTSRLKYKIRKIMHRIVLEIHSNIQFNNTHVVICAYCKLLLQYFDVSNNIVLCHYRELRRKGCVINTTAKSVFWQNTSATYVFIQSLQDLLSSDSNHSGFWTFWRQKFWFWQVFGQGPTR